jgi:hypothetical protein
VLPLPVGINTKALVVKILLVWATMIQTNSVNLLLTIHTRVASRNQHLHQKKLRKRKIRRKKKNLALTMNYLLMTIQTGMILKMKRKKRKNEQNVKPNQRRTWKSKW